MSFLSIVSTATLKKRNVIIHGEYKYSVVKVQPTQFAIYKSRFDNYLSDISVTFQRDFGDSAIRLAQLPDQS